MEVYIDETDVIKKPEFIKSILYDLPNVLAGLFHFLSYFKTNRDNKKGKNDDKERTNNDINYIYNENLPIKYNTKTIIMLILLLCLMSALDDLLWVLIKYIDIVFEERLFYLFLIPLFSKIILNQNIYKHQYFSLLLSLIGVIFLIIPLCLNFEKEFIVPNIFNFIKGINYSLYMVIIKHMIEKYYLSPLKISLYNWININNYQFNWIYYLLFNY